MVVNGLNLALRRAGADQIRSATEKLHAIVGEIGRVEIVAEQPGFVTLEILAGSQREGQRKLLQIERAMPGWRFSEESLYTLPETFDAREIR